MVVQRVKKVMLTFRVGEKESKCLESKKAWLTVWTNSGACDEVLGRKVLVSMNW